VAGVDVCTVSELRAELLAPGGNPGRLTVWSEHALEKCDESIGKLRVV
jgi:large subunit ribosomal protein L4e